MMNKAVYKFISKQTNDPIIEWKTCAISGQEFAIFESDVSFLKKISPKIGGKIYSLPLPRLCPEERQRRRLLFRNERKLYKRKDPTTDNIIISIYAPDIPTGHQGKPYKVYETHYRWSDAVNNIDVGSCVYQYSFKDTYDGLLRQTPLPALYIESTTVENCPYINCTRRSKDSYMAIDSGEIERCYRSNKVYHSDLVLDCFNVDHCNDVYACDSINNCSHCTYVQNSSDCSQSHYLYNCTGCNNCLGCVNLQNKQYYILNKQVKKEDYKTYLEKYISDPQIKQHIQDAFEKLVLQAPHEAIHNIMSEGCYGNNLRECSDSIFCFDMKKGTGCRYVYGNDFQFEDCMDIIIGTEASQSYDSMSIQGHNIYFSQVVGGGRTKNVFYSYFCRDCQYIFGCVGLKNASYCIFNKQYTKQEYEKLVPHIIEQMIETGERGEFPHPSLSPFGYNETVAQEYYPLSKQETLARGYKRQDQEYPMNIPEGMETVEASELGKYEGRLSGAPSIKSSGGQIVDKHILQKAILCEVSGKPFRIIKPELEFYQKHKLSLPRKHPNIRHQERFNKRPGRELYLRTCDKSGAEILSVYPPDSLLKVYSEEAYREEIYG